MAGPGNTDPTRAVYVISVAAELAGLHAQTLRIYERKGLLEPARTPGGSRRYSDADIARLLRIQELTDEGLNLAGVLRVMELEDDLGRAHDEIDMLRAELAAAARRAQERSGAEIVPMPQRTVVAWRQRTTLSSDLHPDDS